MRLPIRTVLVTYHNGSCHCTLSSARGVTLSSRSVSSSSCLPLVGCRKRVVNGCQDPRSGALFQRPYVSDVDP